MIEERKRKLKRKEERYLKELRKRATFNLNVLRKEIREYQHRLVEQSTWNRSFCIRSEGNGVDIKHRNQHSEISKVKE